MNTVFMSQAGRASSTTDPASVLICGVLLIGGLVLVFNWKGAAERFYHLTSSVMFGLVGTATPRLLRFVGGGIAVLGAAGIIVEIVVGLN